MQTLNTWLGGHKQHAGVTRPKCTWTSRCADWHSRSPRSARQASYFDWETQTLYRDAAAKSWDEVHNKLLCLNSNPSQGAVDAVLSDMVPTNADPRQITKCLAGLAKAARPLVSICLLNALTKRGFKLNVFQINAAVNACAKGEEWMEALRLMARAVDHEIELDPITYSSAASACSASQCWQNSIQLFCDMQNGGCHVDKVTLGVAINAYASAHQWHQAAHIFDVTRLRDPELQLDAPLCNAAISALSSGSRWEIAGDLVEQMCQNSISQTAVSLVAILSACGEGQQWTTALEEMRRRSFTQGSSQIACSAAISAFGKATRWMVAGHVLEEMAIKGIQTSYRTQSSLLVTLSWHGHWQGAIVWMEGMHDRQLELNTATFNHCATACADVSQWEEALRVVSDLQLHQLQPNDRSHAIVTGAWARGQHWEHALQTMLLLPRGAAAASLRKARAATVAAFARASKKDVAWDLLNDVQRTSQLPNSGELTSALGACKDALQWPWALELLRAARDRGVQPSVPAYSVAISVFDQAQHWRWSIHVFRQIQHQKLSLDAPAYSATISACQESWDLKQAVALLQEMGQRRVQTDPISYSRTTSACQVGSQWEQALTLIQHAHLGTLNLGADTYNSAISVCTSGQQWRWAWDLQTELGKRNIETDSVTCTAAISACEAASAWESVLQSIDAAQGGGTSVPTITCNAAVAACQTARTWEVANRLMWDLQRHGVVTDKASRRLSILTFSIGRQWQASLDFLNTMLLQRLAPDFGTYGRVLSDMEQLGLLDQEQLLVDPISEACSGGRDYSEEVLRMVFDGAILIRKLFSRESQGDNDGVRSPGRSYGASGQAALLNVWASLRVISVVPERQYTKELVLLRHVLSTASQGEPRSVCKAIERFGRDVLGPTSLWLKVAAGVKSDVLTKAISKAPAGSVLEIGTYCGYSATRIAASCRDAHIVSLEVDPVHAAVARNVLAYAGLAYSVEVWTGYSAELIPALAQRHSKTKAFGGVFMDQKGSRCHLDLAALQELGMLQPGAVIVADNVLKPGAPLFLWRVCAKDDFKTIVVNLKEFAMPAEDWMTVSTYLPNMEKEPYHPDAGQAAPEQLKRLHEESDRMRERATAPGSTLTFEQWAEFADRMRQGFADVGIVATVNATGRLPPGFNF